MSTPAAAEMTKLLENIYRSVNIALVNELKLLCLADGHRHLGGAGGGRDQAVSGSRPSSPGPGVGGHCIPVDPFYLTWKARQFGFETRFIELAGEVNEAMPAYVVETTRRALKRAGKALKGASVLVLGVAYKRDVDDLRESPALTVMSAAARGGCGGGVQRPVFPAGRRGPAIRAADGVDAARAGEGGSIASSS